MPAWTTKPPPTSFATTPTHSPRPNQSTRTATTHRPLAEHVTAPAHLRDQRRLMAPSERIPVAPHQGCEWSNYLAHLDRAIWRYPRLVTTPLACSHRVRRPSGPPDVSQINRVRLV